MEFTYKGVILPYDDKLKSDLNKASCRLFKKISGIDLSELAISEEMKIYFKGKTNGNKTNLIKYSYQLGLALNSINKSYNECTIIDHGGGTGLLGLLAKELGVKRVIYNDINEKCTNDAKTFASKFHLESDYYVTGNLSDLLNFINTNSIICDAIISYDVIEHIYDIKGFFKDLYLLNDKSLVIVMSSGANKFNPFVRRSIVPLQIIAEKGDKNGLFENGKPYLKQREDIIKDYRSELSLADLEKLSICTRGMIKEDILKTVDNFVINHQIPQLPEHPTNTCNPFTGYWAEHFNEPNELKTILIERKFQIKVLVGYYGSPDNVVKRFIAIILNLFLTIVKTRGLFIAPYYTIFAVK